jgi:hypothetical protein
MLWQEPCKEAKTDSRAKFGKESIAKAHKRPEWVPNYNRQVAQALLRHAHPRLRLKQQLLTSAD